MTLRLTIDAGRWQAHVDAVRTSFTDAVPPGAPAVTVAPVVKGNGYGIGRAQLTRLATAWSDLVVVGTVHEALQHERTGDELVRVLTPAVRPVDLPPWIVPTVGAPHHLPAIGGHTGPVAVKLASSMHRYGTDPAGLAVLLAELAARGNAVHAALVHLPLAETAPADDRLAEVESWLAHVPPDVVISVSHLEPATVATLCARHPDRRVEVRLGTALWHGDKSFLHLGADVIDVRPVRAGTRVGYRGTPVEHDGVLVMVGAGSSHGVAPLADGRSPFHLRRRRVALVEAPHMHTSMCLVPDGDPVPEIGEWVDVQRPLTTVAPDEVVWS